MRQGKTDIQVRGVPVTVRDRARARARERGQSLSAYIRELVEADVGRPTMAEWRARVNALNIRFRPVKSLKGTTFADLIREGRHEPGLRP